MQLTSKTLQKITGGFINNVANAETKGNILISGFAIDSRNIKKDNAFVALNTGKVHGGNFARESLSLGASIVIVDEDFVEDNPQIKQLGNILVVEDTLQALEKIAKYCRTFLSTILGITGSVGKTTLKDMLGQAFKNKNIAITSGNFNNHIGLPLCLCNIKGDEELGVFEIGMNKEGEISHLAKILQPNFAIITEISSAHSEYFSSLEAIASAKAEIIDGMVAASVLFINYDNIFYHKIKQLAEDKGIEVLSFSANSNLADIYIKNTKIFFKDINNYGCEIQSIIFGNETQYTIKSISLHNATLSALVLGISQKLGLDISPILENISNFSNPKGRGLIEKLNIGELGTFILIDDSYNASPKSMQGALRDITNIQSSKKVLVLGEMLELGESSEEEHLKLMQYIRNNNPKFVFLIGNGIKPLFEKMQSYYKKDNNIIFFENKESLAKHIIANIKGYDLLFIKGSLGSGVNWVSERLKKYFKTN